MTTFLTSCTKDNTIFDTVTVIKTDTLQITDTLLIKDSSFSTALLTAYPWKTTELRAVYGGDSIYFYRGGTNNTSGFDFSIETYTFYPDGTGFFLDALNGTHLLKDWKFVNSDNTKLTFLVNTTSSPTSISYLITWENIRYKAGSVFTDEYWFDNKARRYYHGQAIRYQSK
jgi:hypothetical protein